MTDWRLRRGSRPRPRAPAARGQACSQATSQGLAFSPTISPTRSSRSVSPSALRDLDSLVHDGDPVADAKQVLQPMGDQDDRDAASATRRISAQDGLDLGHRQRRGGLVHDQDAAARTRRRGRSRSTGVGRRRAGPPSAGRLGIWISSASRWACLLEHPPLGRAAKPGTDVAARGPGTVPGDVDRVAEDEVLVDHLDRLARAPRPAPEKRTGSPSIAIVPRVRGRRCRR